MAQAEWETSNLRTAFPFEFVDDSIKEIFADAMVLDGTRVEDRIRIDGLTVHDGTAELDAVYDSTDTPFFNLSYPVVHIQRYDNWLVLHFEDQAQGKQLILLLNDTLVVIGQPIEDINGLLVARVHEKVAKSLRQIRFTDFEGVEQVVSGNIRFNSGSNMAVVVGDTVEAFNTGGENRVAQAIQLSAIAGAGTGRLPNDCTDDLLRTINGVGPDENGNLLLKAENCYRAGAPIASSTEDTIVVEDHSVQFANICEACCECADFGNVYDAMTRLYNRGRDLGRALQQGRQGYEDSNNTASFERIKREKPRFTVVLQPGPGFVLGVLITVLNNSKTDASWIDNPLQITLTALDPLGPTPAVVTDPRALIIKSNIQILTEKDGVDWKPLTLAQAFPFDEILPSYSLRPQANSVIKARTFSAVYHQIQFTEESASDDLFDKFPIRVEIESLGDFWFAEDDTNKITLETELRKELQET